MTLEEYPSVLLFLKYLNTVFLNAMLNIFGLVINSLDFRKIIYIYFTYDMS